MTSIDTDDIIWGNLDGLTLKAKTSVNTFNNFYKKKIKNRYYSIDRCYIVFCKNTLSLNVQNDR